MSASIHSLFFCYCCHSKNIFHWVSFGPRCKSNTRQSMRQTHSHFFHLHRILSLDSVIIIIIKSAVRNIFYASLFSVKCSAHKNIHKKNICQILLLDRKFYDNITFFVLLSPFFIRILSDFLISGSGTTNTSKEKWISNFSFLFSLLLMLCHWNIVLIICG